TAAPLSIAILLAVVSWPPRVPTIKRRMGLVLSVVSRTRRTHSALPPPLWGRAGEGGSGGSKERARPPPPTPPHKGEGRQKCARAHQRSALMISVMVTPSFSSTRTTSPRATRRLLT